MASSVDAPVRAGYWYCDGDLPIPVASIPSQLFTHLFAAFAEVIHHVNPDTYEVTFPEAYKVQFSTFTQTVQQKKPNVKTLLSIGGDYTSGSATTLASMVSHRNTRQSFIDSSISVARSNNFHGLSLNWIYPSTASDMTNLGYFLEEWRAAVEQESKWTSMDKLLLVAAVTCTPTYGSLTYPGYAISTSLDWINVMGYDFYSPVLSPEETGPFAALKNPKTRQCCVKTGVQGWLDAHVPANKIVLGLPFYGYGWRLVFLEDPKNTWPFLRADGPAKGVLFAADTGEIFYNQIKFFKNTHPDGHGDFLQQYVVDYYCVGNTWIAYNDTTSIKAKVDYARGRDPDQKQQLLGYFAWHLGADDKKDWTLSHAAHDAWPVPPPDGGANASTATE